VKKFALILMIAALAAFLVAPAAMACGGAKSTDAKASCSAKAKTTTADAKNDDAKAKMVGATCTGTAKAGASCSKSCTGAKTTTSTAQLPNGHPAITVAEALKCGDAKVAFLNVNKMTCGSCVAHVNKTLGAMEGVCAVDVNLEKASATVVFHPTQVKTDAMIAAINKAGYEASMMTECSEVMKAVCGPDCSPEKCANMATAGKTCTKKAETSET